MRPSDHYVVISADSHAGADLPDYKPYLEKRWHDEFDVWAKNFGEYKFRFPHEAETNWDSDLRTRRSEEDGVVGEVLFGNTITPFFPGTHVFMATTPAADEYPRRLAAARAHNRWLADFCAQTPGRRAGVAEVLVNDVDDAVAEVRAAKKAGLFGGIQPTLPTPGCGLPALWSPHYDPIWAACCDLDVPVNVHSGQGIAPELVGGDPLGAAMLFVESLWFARRAMWHLMLGGAFDRFPKLKLVLVELGAGWVRSMLEQLEVLIQRSREQGSTTNMFSANGLQATPKTAHDYFRDNVFLGAAFIHGDEVAMRGEIGVGQILWGSDYPHIEGTFPHSKAALRAAFAGVPADEVQRMVGGNAARVYGFDMQKLQGAADRVGPTVEEVARPLAERPPHAFSPVFHPKAQAIFMA